MTGGRRARHARTLAAIGVAVLVGITGLATASAAPKFEKLWAGDGYTNGTEGVALDAAGNIFATAAAGQHVLKLDPEGALVTEWGSGGGADGQFTSPCGVATNPIGTTVYVADLIANRVQKFDGNGGFLLKWGSTGGADDQFVAPCGIAVDLVGNVDVADTTNRIQRFTPSGVHLATIGGATLFDSLPLSGPMYITTDGQNNMYIVDGGNARVVVLDAADAFVRAFPIAVAGRGIAVDDANGDIYVVEGLTSQIHHYNATGVSQGFIGSAGSGDGQMSNPRGLALDESGHLFVGDQNNTRIVEFDTAGTFLANITGQGNGNSARFNSPLMITTDPATDNVFVIDRNNNRIEEFTPGGRFLGFFGQTGPAAAVFDSVGDHLFVTEQATDSVIRYDGTSHANTGSFSGTIDGESLVSPSGIALGNNLLYVADNAHDRIVSLSVVDLSPDVEVVDATGTGDGELNGPTGVAINAAGTELFVVDTDNNRVQVFDPSNGAFIRKWGSSGSANGQFALPQQISVLPTGNVAVADTGNDRIQLFTPTGQFLASYTGTDSGVALSDPNGVAFDSAGIGYIGDTGNNRVVRFGFGGGLVPIAPVRILDTRNGTGAPIGPIAPGGTLALDVTNTFGSGVPATGVDAVILNVTATKGTKNGWLTLFPNGQSLPLASNLNFKANQNIANLVVVAVPANGMVSINNSGGLAGAGTVHVVADAVGWYANGQDRTANLTAAEFVGVPPVRILDTRNGTGAPIGAVAPNGTVALDVLGAPDLPSECDGATAAVLNVTATKPTKSGWLTAYPADTVLPIASNLNFLASQTVPNLVTVKLGTSGGDAGMVKIENTDLPSGLHPISGTVHVIADLAGCYKPIDLGSAFLTTFSPQRILDTRIGTGAPIGAVAPNGTIVVDPQVASPSVPAVGTYTGVIVNITATGATKSGWLTAYPSDATLPLVSNLNFVAGQSVPNLVKVKVGADGKFNIENTDLPSGPHPISGTVHVVVDIVGYYQ